MIFRKEAGETQMLSQCNIIVSEIQLNRRNLRVTSYELRVTSGLRRKYHFNAKTKQMQSKRCRID
jgi:hypothetical protein